MTILEDYNLRVGDVYEDKYQPYGEATWTVIGEGVDLIARPQVFFNFKPRDDGDHERKIVGWDPEAIGGSLRPQTRPVVKTVDMPVNIFDK